MDTKRRERTNLQGGGEDDLVTPEVFPSGRYDLNEIILNIIYGFLGFFFPWFFFLLRIAVWV